MTGHQNIPDEALTHIRAELGKALCGLGEPIEALTSLAAGADQLFAQIALSCGASLKVVTPSEDYADTFSAEEDRARYLELRKLASAYVNIGHKRASEQAYYDAGVYITDHSDLMLAVWDGQPAKGFGGTADIVNYAHSKKVTVIVIWKDGIVRG
ncbi:hypothetical protein AB0L56_23455 [Streptomyces sp. NPDC052079]|uniref:hypothetical protein n=1 Tax=Streptomyces sp. NPDC052079 TaxID=3155526 RepID=UPI0034359333